MKYRKEKELERYERKKARKVRVAVLAFLGITAIVCLFALGRTFFSHSADASTSESGYQQSIIVDTAQRDMK